MLLTITVESIFCLVMVIGVFIMSIDFKCLFLSLFKKLQLKFKYPRSIRNTRLI
jgi:hypothetical protein